MPSAQPEIAGEGDKSRRDRTRLGLLVPIGAIVAVAIVCVALAVLTSARRANEAAIDSQQQLIRDSIADRGERTVHLLESIASNPQAALRIRDSYDLAWVDRRIGTDLINFKFSIVAIVGADDQIKYANSRVAGDASAGDLRADLAPILDLMRGRLSAMPGNAINVRGAQNLAAPGRSSALIMSFRNKPAIVAAAAVGSDSDLANGNGGAPILLGVKYIDGRLLAIIGGRLKLDGLREIEGTDPTADEHVTELTDAQGGVIARIAFKPKLPGPAIVASVAPFVVAALAGFAVLVGLLIRYMRRTSAAISAGERQLRHLALHDPVSGLPNRIYFSERLEQSIQDVRGGGLSAAVFYIDLDHFKDVNDTLGHHIGDAYLMMVTGARRRAGAAPARAPAGSSSSSSRAPHPRQKKEGGGHGATTACRLQWCTTYRLRWPSGAANGRLILPQQGKKKVQQQLPSLYA